MNNKFKMSEEAGYKGNKVTKFSAWAENEKLQKNGKNSDSYNNVVTFQP